MTTMTTMTMKSEAFVCQRDADRSETFLPGGLGHPSSDAEVPPTFGVEWGGMGYERRRLWWVFGRDPADSEKTYLRIWAKQP
jgi:hypothetical protein